jgi:LysM repeat protein
LKYSVNSLLIKVLISGVIYLTSSFNETCAQEKEHTIKGGETISSIAKKYKTTVANLIQLNPEAKAGIKAGATLKIPGVNGPEIKTLTPQASIPIENSKKYMVKSGDSFKKIASKFKVKVSDLEKWNGFNNSGLKSGVEIWVSQPEKEVELVKENPRVEKTSEMKEVQTQKEHKIVKSETLSTIAKKYGTTTEEIKKVNKLKSTQINLGQVLIIPGAVDKEIREDLSNKKSEPVQKVQDPISVQKQEIKQVVKKEEKKEQEKVVVPPTTEENSPKPEKEIEEPKAVAGSIREVSNSLGYTRVVETGFAEAIEGDVNSKKHLCLHKSAAIGSILQVKNEANGQSVFVKVIGKLPETGSNEKLIIRISRQAYDRLYATGKRFAVEVSYPESQ